MPVPLSIIPFVQITYLRLCFRPFDINVLERILQSMPGVRRFSIETLVYNLDYIRSPFWTLLLQKYFPLLERVRLIVRGWLVSKISVTIPKEDKLDSFHIIDGYRYDRYWLDRTQKRFFHYHADSYSAVLQIR
jgi:hypothetical protein